MPPSPSRSTATSYERYAAARALSAARQSVRRDPAKLWKFYIQLVEIEAAFKNLKDDLQLRPICHQLEHCLHVTLRARLKPLAAGLTAREVLDKPAAIQMLDVHFPTTDGRTLIPSRYTELTPTRSGEPTQARLPSPAATAHHPPVGGQRASCPASVVETFGGGDVDFIRFFSPIGLTGAHRRPRSALAPAPCS
jgi:hypothetical protein